MIVQWWRDWKSFGVLPYGGSDLKLQPAYVLQAFRICEAAADKARSVLESMQK